MNTPQTAFDATLNCAISICRHPVFVIGSPRSGTTALAFALAQHSDFWTAEESQILWDLFSHNRLRANYRRNGQFGGSWLERHNIAQEQFLNYIGIGLNALFTSQSQGKRWVDHTPVYTLLVDDLVDLFPGAYFIHILRDGRSVVRSMINYQKRFANDTSAGPVDAAALPTWAGDFGDACQTWSQFVEKAMDFQARLPERCITVANEALVEEPERVFAEILRFIQADPEEGPARYFQSHRINSSFQTESATVPPYHKVQQIWDGWTEEQRAIFAEHAGETQARYCAPVPASAYAA